MPTASDLFPGQVSAWLLLALRRPVRPESRPKSSVSGLLHQWVADGLVSGVSFREGRADFRGDDAILLASTRDGSIVRARGRAGQN